MVFYKSISIYILNKPEVRSKIRIKAYKAAKINIQILLLIKIYLANSFLPTKKILQQM